MEKGGEPLREIIILNTKIFNKETLSVDNTVKGNTIVDIPSDSVYVDEIPKPTSMMDPDSPEPPDKPSIWVGSPIFPIPSPPCSPVDSTELNIEIVEFQLKGSNLQFFNLGETLTKEADNSVNSVDGSEACLPSETSEKVISTSKSIPKKKTRSNKKKKAFNQVRKQSKPISVTPSPPEKAASAPILVDNDEIPLSELRKKLLDAKSSSKLPAKTLNAQVDENEWKVKVYDDEKDCEP